MKRTGRYFGGDGGCDDGGKWADLTSVWEAASTRPAAEPDVRVERGGSDTTPRSSHGGLPWGGESETSTGVRMQGENTQLGSGSARRPSGLQGEVTTLCRLFGEGILPGDGRWESQA